MQRRGAILGNAAEYNLGETRRELLEAVRAHGSLTPKQAAEVTGTDYGLVKVTLWPMSKDGQIRQTRAGIPFKTELPP